MAEPLMTPTQLAAWCGTSMCGESLVMQGFLILVSGLIGLFLYRLISPHLKKSIEYKLFPLKLQNVLNNLRKVVAPALVMVVLLIATQAALNFLPFDMHLAMAAIKLLIAWIIITILGQFIANRFVRNVFIVAILAMATLSIFGILGTTSALLDEFGFNIGKFRLSALVFIKASISLFVLLYLATFISTFAEQKVLQITGFKRSTQVLLAKVIRISLIVIALLIGVASAGIDLSVFAVFSGAVGLGVGFGLQKVISNLFSGMLLLMDKSIVPGDIIELENGIYGWVNYMGARYTEITTRDNKSYLVPNEDFITQRVCNWSHGNTLIRIEVKFGLDYTHNPREIQAMAIQAAAKPARACEDPAPVCHLTEFAANSINFVLRFWIQDAEKGIVNIKSEVMLALWDIFQENNIKFPYPHMEVYMHRTKP